MTNQETLDSELATLKTHIAEATSQKQKYSQLGKTIRTFEKEWGKAPEEAKPAKAEKSSKKKKTKAVAEEKVETPTEMNVDLTDDMPSEETEANAPELEVEASLEADSTPEVNDAMEADTADAVTDSTAEEAKETDFMETHVESVEFEPSFETEDLDF